MSDEEIQKLLDQASGMYNDGRYEAAIDIWNRVLEAEPGNERAEEGIKMARLLTSEWEEESPQVTEAPAEAPPQTPLDAAALEQVQGGIQRVQQLLAAGDLARAQEGSEALLQLAPGDAAVLACAARVEAAGNPEAYVGEQLALARHYLMLGDTAEATAACHRVLAVDPAHAGAKEMLGGEAAAEAPAEEPGGGPVQAADRTLDLGPADEVVAVPLAQGPDTGAAPEAPAEPVVPDSAGALAEEGAKAPAEQDSRVSALLADGDRLREEGRLDEAIDAWSRIFILQDNHAEAERRIDAARQVLEEQARQMEEHLYRGDDLQREGRLEEAKAEFEAIVQIRSEHAEARGRIEAIEKQIQESPRQPVPPPVEPAAPPAPQPEPLELPKFESVPLLDDEDHLAPLPTSKAPLPPPPPAARRGLGLPLWIAIGVLAVALLGAGGYYAWGILFPKVNMAPLQVPPRAGAGQAGPEGGGTESPPEAGQVASGQEPAPPDPAPGGAPAVLTAEESQARSKEQMRAGISMFRLADYETAVKRFDEALQTDPANFEAQDWLGRAQQAFAQVQEYQTDLESIENDFDDGNYHRSLYKLYRLEPPSPEEQETLDSWMGVCWYNWGVTLLKQRKVEDAEEKFEEALGIWPDDPEATRHLALVRRYNNRKIDDAYDTYARRLTLRPLN